MEEMTMKMQNPYWDLIKTIDIILRTAKKPVNPVRNRTQIHTVRSNISNGIRAYAISNGVNKTEIEQSLARFQSMLAWRDAFRIYDWARALPVPELAVSQIKQLMALADIS